MTGWTKLGFAAAAALAIAPAARADDTKRETAATSAQTSGAMNEEQRTNKMPPPTSGIGREENTGGPVLGSDDPGRSGQERAGSASGQRAEPSAENAAVNLGDQEKQKEMPSKHDNTDVIQKLWSANVAEIKMAEIAKDQAQSEQVKSFADRMVKDHGEIRDALAELAEKRNLKLDEDAALAPHKAHLEQAEKLEGAQFDRHFTSMMVKEHAKSEKDGKAALKRAKQSGDHELAQVIQSAQTKIKEHHRMAASLDKSSKQRMGRRATDSAARAGATTESKAEQTGAKVEGSAERAGEKIESGAEQTGEKIESGAERAGEKIESGAERAGDKVEQQTDKAKDDR